MSIMKISEQTTDQFEWSFATLKEALDAPHERIKIEDSLFTMDDATAPGKTAIHVERPKHFRFADSEVDGLYEIGVFVAFGLYARFQNTSARRTKIGYQVGCGTMMLNADGTQKWDKATFTNSASNQARFVQARYQGFDDDGIGFYIFGADNVIFEQTTVEGKKVDVAWKIYPKAANSNTEIKHGWLETTEQCKTAIEYDGYYGTLVVDGLNISHAPDLLLNAAGDQNSRIIFRNNNWKEVPPLRIGRKTKVIAEGDTNRFGQQQLDDATTRV